MIGAHKAINYVSQLRSNQIELLIKKRVSNLCTYGCLNCVQYIQINPSFSSQFEGESLSPLPLIATII